MPKYNLGNKSGMRRFMKDLNNEILSKAESAAQNMTFDINCSECQRSYKARAGVNTCPYCRATTDVQLNIKQ